MSLQIILSMHAMPEVTTQEWRSLSLSAQLFRKHFSHYKNTDKKRFVLGTEYLEQKHTGLSSVDDAWHGSMCNRDMDAREKRGLRCSTSSEAPKKKPLPTAEAIDLRESAPEIVFRAIFVRLLGGISSVSIEHSAVTQ